MCHRLLHPGDRYGIQGHNAKIELVRGPVSSRILYGLPGVKSAGVWVPKS